MHCKVLIEYAENVSVTFRLGQKNKVSSHTPPTSLFLSLGAHAQPGFREIVVKT